jgi:hypothetical protein
MENEEFPSLVDLPEEAALISEEIDWSEDEEDENNDPITVEESEDLDDMELVF